MLPQHEQRETEQHWEERRMEDGGGDRRADAPPPFPQPTRFGSSAAGESRRRHRRPRRSAAAAIGRRARSRRPCRREIAARPDRGGRSAPRRRRTAPVCRPEQMLREQDRRGRLEAVEDQRQRGEPLAAGPQHIGRADIARADRRGRRPCRRAGSAAARTGSTRADSRAPERRASRGSWSSW